MVFMLPNMLMIGFQKSIPVSYRLVESFPPEYFRQEMLPDFR